MISFQSIRDYSVLNSLRSDRLIQNVADSNAGKVIRNRGVVKLLSGEWKPKAVKRCAITKKVGAGCSEPAAKQPTLAEIDVRHTGGNTDMQWSSKRETTAKTVLAV